MHGAALLLLRFIGSALGQVAFLMGVRRDVTLDNLHHAFPTKESHELRAIARRSYANLCIVFAEMLYLRYASRTAVLNGLYINNLAPTTHLLFGPNGAPNGRRGRAYR